MNDLEAFLENLSLEGVVGPVSENRMAVPILSGIVGKVDIFTIQNIYPKELKQLHKKFIVNETPIFCLTSNKNSLKFKVNNQVIVLFSFLGDRR